MGHHTHHRRRIRLFARSRSPVYLFQFHLKTFIEYLVAMQSKKRKQFPRPLQSLQQKLFLLAGLSSRIPSLHDLNPPVKRFVVYRLSQIRSRTRAVVDPLL